MNNERNYNFRRANKIKEQKRRALIYEFGFFPTMPKKSKGNKGKSYYVEGCKDNYKQLLKKTAVKKVRQSNLDEIGNGSDYKKLFNLKWNWY